jgi:hypothetical protein
MKIKFISPSGKTIQSKIAVFLRAAEKQVLKGMPEEEAEEQLKASLKSIIERSILVQA